MGFGFKSKLFDTHVKLQPEPLISTLTEGDLEPVPYKETLFTQLRRKSWRKLLNWKPKAKLHI
jgi:hypothetical protein